MHSGVLSSLSHAYTIQNVSDPQIEVMLNVKLRDPVKGRNYGELDDAFPTAQGYIVILARQRKAYS